MEYNILELSVSIKKQLALSISFCYYTNVASLKGSFWNKWKTSNPLGGAKMAKCDICGKGVHFGNNVSHSHRRSNRIWNSNVRNVKCKVNGTTKSMHVCTRCLRSGAVERA